MQLAAVWCFVQNLNELQAYVLVFRWSKRHKKFPQVCRQLLQDMESAYFLERIHLLRSMEHLKLYPAAGQPDGHSVITSSIAQAASDELVQNLCLSLMNSLDPLSSDSLHSISASGATAADAMMTSERERAKDQQHRQQQQALLEQDVMLHMLISVFEQQPCSADCCAKLMQSLHLHLFRSWHMSSSASILSNKVICLVSPRQQALYRFCTLLDHQLKFWTSACHLASMLPTSPDVIAV